MDYYIYDTTGRILETGKTVDIKQKKLKSGEFIGKGIAYEVTQMVLNGELITAQVPLYKQIPDKPETILHLPTLSENQQAKITNEQLQSILDRLAVLEAKLKI